MKKTLRLAIMLLVLIAATGCEHRDLCYDHSSHMTKVRLEFDWSQAPDANPATMVVWFFPTDGSQGHRYEILPAAKTTRSTFNAQLSVPPGSYRVLCHNGSTENNIEQGYRFEDYSLTSFDDELLSPLNRAESAPRPGDSGEEPVKAQASEIWAHTLSDAVTLKRGDSEGPVIKFTPRPMHEVWHIVIRNVQNMSADMDLSAIITGVAESHSTASGGPSGREVTVPVKVKKCGDDCLTADAVLFGDNAPHDVKHYLRIYTSFNYYYDFDITDRVHGASDHHYIEILIDGLKLHNPTTGLTPGVSGWEDSEDQELIM